MKAGGPIDSSCEENTVLNKQLLCLLEGMKVCGGGEEPGFEMVCIIY
jgi:hypothetical protein